jgi:hypothetical protein
MFTKPTSLLPSVQPSFFNISNISAWIPGQDDLQIKKYWRPGKRIIHDSAGVGTLLSLNDYGASVKLRDDSEATFPLKTLHPLFYYGDHLRRLAENTPGEVCLFLGNPDWSDDGELVDIPRHFTRGKSPLALVQITETSEKVKTLLDNLGLAHNSPDVYSSFAA